MTSKPVFIAERVYLGTASTEAEARALYAADYGHGLTADGVTAVLMGRPNIEADKQEIEAAEADCPDFYDAWIVERA